MTASGAGLALKSENSTRETAALDLATAAAAACKTAGAKRGNRADSEPRRSPIFPEIILLLSS